MSYPAADRLHDSEGRRLRAQRMCRIIEAFSDVELGRCRVLDVGASHLLIAREIARTGAEVIGVDVDRAALAWGLSAGGESPVAAVAASAEALPFRDACFDVVLCNHVYEHVPDPHQLVAEIRRVLKPGGLCYFAGGHKYQLIEPHYRVPFLSWVPEAWATRLLRRRGLGEYDIRFLDQPGMSALLAPFAEGSNVTSDLLARADEFDLAPHWAARLFRFLPGGCRRALSRLAPTQIWLLRT